MAKAAKRKTGRTPASVGRTFDGVYILRPKTKSSHFTSEQLRAAIAQVMSESSREKRVAPRAGDIYVEKRPNGAFAVRRHGSDRASAILPTQKEAIERARELAPDKHPIIERVRHTGGSGKWRKA